MARIVARIGNPCERRGSNTLPLSGTRKAKWHLSKRRVSEVDEGAMVVVREAPNDRGKEVDRQWRKKRGMVEDSFSRLSLVARCSPENQRLAVEWLGYINCWDLVCKHAETRVRNDAWKVNRARRGRSVGGVGRGRGLCVEQFLAPEGGTREVLGLGVGDGGDARRMVR